MPIGTLIQKIDRQPTPSTNSPSEDGAERQADPHRGAPDADRLSPLTGIVEDVADDPHRHRVEHRAPHRLQHAEGDQQAERGGDAAQQRRDREDDEPRLEDAAAAEPVPGGPAEDQQAREHERVGVDDPLQARDTCVQFATDRGQGDVDDRVVEPDDQQAHAADHEDQPPSRTVRPGNGGRLFRGVHNALVCPLRGPRMRRGTRGADPRRPRSDAGQQGRRPDDQSGGRITAVVSRRRDSPTGRHRRGERLPKGVRTFGSHARLLGGRGQ